MKIVIGLVGQKRGQESKFIRVVTKVAKKKTVEIICKEKLLADFATRIGVKPQRKKLRTIEAAMDVVLEEGAFFRAIRRKIVASEADIIIVSGIWLLSEEKMFRALGEMFPRGSFKSHLVYIYVDEGMHPEHMDHKIKNNGTKEEFEIEVRRVWTEILKKK